MRSNKEYHEVAPVTSWYKRYIFNLYTILNHLTFVGLLEEHRQQMK